MKTARMIGLLMLACARPALAQTQSGPALFEARCSGCHVAAGGGQGPSLIGVVGRKAGAVAGFEYTSALKASGIVWTSAKLDQFLADPGKMVPGTAMPIRVPDAAQRAAIISHLASGR